MLGRLWPRFALEAFFLIAVALVAGLLNLSVAEVVVVMAVAYLLTVAFELFSWRARRSEGDPVFPLFSRNDHGPRRRFDFRARPGELRAGGCFAGGPLPGTRAVRVIQDTGLAGSSLFPAADRVLG